MLLHRICVAEFGGTAQAAFSGQGGMYGSGRWHQRGRPIVYTACHRSLALLEILAHLDRHWQLQPMVAWEIDVPETHILTPADLPENWRSRLEATRNFGDTWLAGHESAALRVPSVIVPTEFNVLLNPSHPEFRIEWVKNGPEPLEIDPRLL